MNDLETEFAEVNRQFLLFFIDPFAQTIVNLFAHFDMGITTVYAQTDDKLLLEAVKRLDEQTFGDESSIDLPIGEN